jgi:hypothetical protein
LPRESKLQQSQAVGLVDEVAERALQFQKVGREGAGGLLCASGRSRSDQSRALGLGRGSM